MRNFGFVMVKYDQFVFNWKLVICLLPKMKAYGITGNLIGLKVV
jgi:hypothetical protein